MRLQGKMNTGGTKFADVVIVMKTPCAVLTSLLSYLSNTPGFCNVDIPASPRVQIFPLYWNQSIEEH
jgi:hypothetical protein